MRIATWNVNSVVARLPRLTRWLGEVEPDVVCLQEIKTSEDAFPSDAVGELGYEAAVHGTGRWNGVQAPRLSKNYQQVGIVCTDLRARSAR